MLSHIAAVNMNDEKNNLICYAIRYVVILSSFYEFKHLFLRMSPPIPRLILLLNCFNEEGLEFISNGRSVGISKIINGSVREDDRLHFGFLWFPHGSFYNASATSNWRVWWVNNAKARDGVKLALEEIEGLANGTCC